MKGEGISDAAEITKASDSNLALAFLALPRQRRKDITVFYAFCRIVDDIADDPELDVLEKKHRLDQWRAWLAEGAGDLSPLAEALRKVIGDYDIPREHFFEILSGVEMDLHPRLYATFADLRIYCYRVASAVGLISIEIFGYRREETKRYALDLGMALQLTNIIRDVGADLENGGRIYLPLEDLRRFHYDEQDLRDRVHDQRFVDLMRFEAERARLFYHSANVHLLPEDQNAMVAARIMQSVYGRLLQRMKADEFRVFDRRYSLGRAEKIWIVFRHLASRWCSLREQPAAVPPANPRTDLHE